MSLSARLEELLTTPDPCACAPGIGTVGDDGIARCDACGRVMVASSAAELLIWNSRDGVTPFLVEWRGLELSHVDFASDIYAPFHLPAVGDRIFVDLTREAARKYAIAHLEAAPDWYTARWPSRQAAVEGLTNSLYGDGRNPDLVVVDELLRRRIAARSLASLIVLGCS